MGSEAGYLLAVLGEEGLPTVPLFGLIFSKKFKNGRNNSKKGAKFNKVIKNFATLRRHILSSACPVLVEGGAVRGEGKSSWKVAGYTYESELGRL